MKCDKMLVASFDLASSIRKRFLNLPPLSLPLPSLSLPLEPSLSLPLLCLCV